MANAMDFYERAIARLKNYRSTEPDSAKRAEATAEIQRLEIATQSAALNRIAERSGRLAELLGALRRIAARATSSGAWRRCSPTSTRSSCSTTRRALP